MASYLGIDFGSTYTMMSSYDDDTADLSAIQVQGESQHIPSVACLRANRLLVGTQAHNALMRNANLQHFRAFKMLLHEPKEESYLNHGYTRDYPPQKVAKEFLQKYTALAAQNRNVNQFDHAVICVPEHWIANYSRMSGRAIVLDICENLKNDAGLPLMKSIRVVTEPLAATAYYAHNYRIRNGTPFTGNIIVIDYGGGTLDITVTEVTARPGNNGTSTMEIKSLWSDGVGENHDKSIGDAGLRYMEQVTAIALEAAGVTDYRIDSSFLEVQDFLETTLMHETRSLSNYIASHYGPADLDEMADDCSEFALATYGDLNVPITYAMLYKAFTAPIRETRKSADGTDVVITKKSIQDTLNEYLNRLKAYLDEEDLDPLRHDSVKLAVVGGFGQFPLVRNAIWSFFGLSREDNDLLNNIEGGRENAVSYGAALIAGNVISVQTTSDYSIGLRVIRSTGESYDYAILCGQQVDCSHIYHLGEPDGADWYPMWYNGAKDSKSPPLVFAVDNARPSKKKRRSKEPPYARRMEPLPDVSQRLHRALKSKVPTGTYYVGFSMNESGIYTLHIFPQDPETKTRISTAIHTETLGNFNEIFGDLIVDDPNDKKLRIYK